MSEQASPSQTQGPQNSSAPHDSDSDPMVYITPRDYASSARQSRSQHIAEGADPASIILQSELSTRIPRHENESPADYVKRYSETMNAMIRSGVKILNDECIADQVPDTFSAGGKVFDLGPGSGATKGEYREFGEWFEEACGRGGELGEVPARWRRFEKPAGTQA
ncbi:uncharacterized protein CC84DRAFT_1163767 [Paraphaeosphaeria sporulosa]|uniref:Uncharacterized protein n=1 Tax=Paraphaeosphaeria sporulosa TaxID=1460663 RepID=A0A177CJD2_9PLEO|nr:uncharacterized protein CC84DRAFT_1163767 [Paraphaeosphaeria sporulosa]OAG07644.1 hypothetical protein CC84DRAFT_1163767 [Paraphaeosphaeria sporulosa]